MRSLRVEVADGSWLDVALSVADDPAAPVLIVWPAFGAPARFYRKLSRAALERGWSTAVVEWRGHGDSGPRIGRDARFGYHHLAALDAPAVVDAVAAALPRAPRILLGHSLGGHVCCLYAGRHALREAEPRRDVGVSGIVLAASASPYHRSYTGPARLRALTGTTAMAAVARVVGYWPGDRLRFWGRQSRVLMGDWARVARTGRFRPAEADVDYDAGLRAVRLPVLAMSIEGDPLAPVRAVDRLLTSLPNARVTRWHSDERIGHIQWVRHSQGPLDAIEAWLPQALAT